MLEKLSYYLSFGFVRYALIAGVLIALCSALLGVSLVLKRYSMIGDGLSRVAFGASAIAMAMSVAPLYLSLPVTVLAAVFLLRSGGKKTAGDSLIALISVSSLALGYLILNIFASKSSNLTGDVCSILFGSTSILTLKQSDVWLCAALAAGVTAAYILLYHRIFAVTFDEGFASATGTRVKTYNTLIAVITAVVIVLAMNLVGALLISALIIFPALSAMRLFKSFRAVIVFSAVISVVCAFFGIFAAVLCDTPVGSTIVAANLTVFIICTAAGMLKGGKNK